MTVPATVLIVISTFFVMNGIPVENQAVPECVSHDQCPIDRACQDSRCANPCADRCGHNTVCQVQQHIPTCACKPGFTGNPLTFCRESEWHSKYPGKKKMYYIDMSQKLNWHAAFFQCMKNNSLLANIETVDDFQEITHLIETSGLDNVKFWLGGNDVDNEGEWVWSNGQEISGFTRWAPNEPNNYEGSEHCNFMRTKAAKYEWNDIMCNDTLNFLCEYRLGSEAIGSDWPPATGGQKKFYLESRMKVDWHSAYMYCLRNNSCLARIENKVENDIVVNMVKEANLGFDLEYWLGATDFPEVGQYFWLSTGLPIKGFSNWHAGQGMAEDQRCLTYWQSSQHVVRWNDFICSTLYPFICEYYE